jgi:hypothetical protein
MGALQMSAAAYLGLIVTYPARWVVHKMSLPEARRPDEQASSDAAWAAVNTFSS